MRSIGLPVRFSYKHVHWNCGVVLCLMMAWSIVAYCGEIHEAAADGDLQRVKELLEADRSLISNRDDSGKTPLHWAVSGGQEDVAMLLIQQFADVNARDDDGETPLFLAAQMGRTRMITLLMESPITDVNLADRDGETPLHEAVLHNDKEVAERLLARNAPPRRQDGLGDAPVDRADADRRLGMADALSPGHVAVVDAKDNDGETPLALAVTRDESGLAELLLARGAKTDIPDNNALTPLQLAVKADDGDMVQLLFAHGADVNSESSPPLLTAEQFSRVKMIISCWRMEPALT